MKETINEQNPQDSDGYQAVTHTQAPDTQFTTKKLFFMAAFAPNL